MAVSTEKIPDYVQEEIARQDQERFEFASKEIERQDRLRNGDYPLNTVPGALQGAVGAVETVGNMMSSFFGSAPAAVAGLIDAVHEDGFVPTRYKPFPKGAGDEYTETFHEVADFFTYSPRSKKGKRWQGDIADTYNKYIEEGWGDYVGGLVEGGYITPAEGAYFRSSADALLMGLFIKGGQYAYKAGSAAAKARGGRSRGLGEERPIDDLSGDYIPGGGADAGLPVARGSTVDGSLVTRAIGEQKKLPGPQRKLSGPVDNVIKLQAQKRLSASIEESAGSIFKNKQAGAVDMNVLAEGVKKVLRPGVRGVKTGLDLSHALARQVAFKQVTDIRKQPSPTAKMLADRIMPSEQSTIVLENGFHELVRMTEGAYNQRFHNIVSPLYRHVANKNSMSTLRVVALPKNVNDAIIQGLETGVAPEKVIPAVRAIRSIFDDLLEYQQEAGVAISSRDGFFPHLWNEKKIRNNPKGFTQYLVDIEGVEPHRTADIIATITQEEGFLDFVEDAGGRLGEKQDYSQWAGRVRSVGGGPAKPSHTKRRSLNGTFKESKEWLVNDLEAVVSSYVPKAARHAEYTRIAGPGERNLNDMVRQIIEEVEFHAKEGGKVKASSPHQIAQEIYDMFDAMQGRFHQHNNPSVRRASKAASGFQVIHKLHWVTLAQFPETLMPAVKYRVATETKGGIPIPLKSYAVGLMDAVWNAGAAAAEVAAGRPVLPKSEIKQHLERIGVSYVDALQSSASRMAGPTGIITNRIVRGFFLEQFTNLQRGITYDTIVSMIRQNARYLAKGLAQGKKAKMYRQELTELGIKPEAAIEWYRAGMPKDHPINKQFDTALVRGTNTTTIIPEAANAPRLYNDPRFQLPLIFTRFFTVFGNTVLKHVIKKFVSGEVTNTRKLASLGALMAAVGVSYYTQFLREDLTGYQFRDEDDPMRVVDAVDRAGLTTVFTRVYPLFSPYRYGGGKELLLNIALGPMGGDVAKLIDAVKGDNESRAKFLAQMTPIMTATPPSEEVMYEFYLELIEALNIPEGK